MIDDSPQAKSRADFRMRQMLRFSELPMAATPTAERSSVQILLLGTPRLAPSGAAHHALERKDAALLALLAIDGALPRARAAALLWPDADDDKARNNLRQRLFRLRRTATRDVVIAESVLRLAEGVEHDLDELPRRLNDDPAAGAGELLGDFDYNDCPDLADWVRAAREQWRLGHRNALIELAAQCESRREIARALIYAERAVAEDPLHEHAHRRVMRLHYLRGDRSAALAAYERCRGVLERELKATPGAETRELLALITASGTLPGAAPAPTSVGILRPPRLVGRDAEWSRLRELESAGGVALVRGEAGIGKTRLLADFVASRQDALMVGARPGDARVPYSLLVRLLRALLARTAATTETWVRAELSRILPELGEAPRARLDELRLRQAVRQVLESGRRVGSEPAIALIAIDDLQFADGASLDLLLALVAAEDRPAGEDVDVDAAAPDAVAQAARQEVMPPLVWLLGVRGGEMPARLGEWLGESVSTGVIEIDLRSLDVEQIAALVDSLAIPGLEAARWAQPLARHTGGNPLFILETLRTLLPHSARAPESDAARLPIPSSVGELIERRLQQLSPDALRLARAAALAGQDFSVELASRVLQRHALDLSEAWRELEDAQVIRAGAFAHDLIFEATLRSVPAPIAQLMHRDIAGYLEGQGSPPARVAQHWFGAQEWGRAGDASVAAALQARRASQRSLEVEHWQRAAECFERAGRANASFDARCASIEALILMQGTERAGEVAETLVRDARTRAQRVAALTARALVRLMAADTTSGIADAREAYELAAVVEETGVDLPPTSIAVGAFDARWARFEAARLLAVGLSQDGRAEDALPLIEPFREVIELTGTPEQRFKFWSDYAYTLNSAKRLRLTADALARSIDIARHSGDFAELASNTSNLALVQANLGRVDEALEQSLRARAVHEHLGETSGPTGAAIDMYTGWMSGAVGRYREAIASLDAALACFRRDAKSVFVAVAQHHLALVMLDLGQVARASKLIEGPAPEMTSVHARRKMLAGRIERRLGRRGEDEVREALAILGDKGDRFILMLALIEEAMLLTPAAAAVRCLDVQRMAEGIEYFGVASKARWLHARFLLTAEDPKAAAAVLRNWPAQLANVPPADLYRGETFWIAFEVYAAAGDATAARRALEDGVAWVRETALPNVPDEFRDSFLDRNPTNRAMLTAATRKTRAPGPSVTVR